MANVELDSQLCDKEEDIHVEELIPGYKDINQFTQTLLSSTIKAVRASNSLPLGDSYDFYSSFRAFRQILSAEGKNIFSIISPLLRQQGCVGNIESLELDEKFDALVDATDSVLEKVGNALDEASGLKKKEEELIIATVNTEKVINASWNRKKKQSASPSSQYRLLASKNVIRPQVNFKDKIDNSNSPFVPIITEKPNSLKPLAILPQETEFGEEYGHPYEVEIEHFEPSSELFEPVEPQKPKALQDTPLIFVNNITSLKALCEDLSKQKEFAVDLEHHSYRTYQGFTCLMQISTRNIDYIVDTLELRSELHILNDVFTNPKIVKVFHGADMDVLWLQRDLGIYIVNMFDTGQASRVLNFARIALSYLLKHYCQFEPDKKFQLADWRIRPLPDEMVKYAREDTHYLLYVYDCLRNDLLKKAHSKSNLLQSVYQRSKLICLKTYRKPVFSEESHLDLYRKSKKVFNSRQLYALKHLYAWRDKIARIEDESIGYVLPNHMLLQIAEVLPREQQGILACCNPIPPLVKQQLNELHMIILKARETSLVKPEVSQFHIEVSVAQSKIDMESLLHCPHDIVLNPEGDEHLPTLLNFDDDASTSMQDQAMKQNTSHEIPMKEQAILTAVVNEGIISKKVEGLNQLGEILKKFISPYERYKAVKPAESSDRTVPEDMPRIVKIEKDMDDQESPACADVVAESPQPEERVQDVHQKKEEPNEMQMAPEKLEAPLRKKNKRKRKHRVVPDISLIVNTESEKEPSNKRQKSTDGSSNNVEFTPFDYSNADTSKTSATSSKKQFDPDKARDDFLKNFQPPGKVPKKKRLSSNLKSKTFRNKAKRQESPGQAQSNRARR